MARKAHADKPRANFTIATYYIFEAADRQAVSVVDEYRYRLLPAKWADKFIARGSEACEDEACRSGMKIVAPNARLKVQQR